LNQVMRLQSCEKVMGWCTAQCKMLLFCAKTIESHTILNYPIWRRRWRKKQKHFGCLATFWL